MKETGIGTRNTAKRLVGQGLIALMLLTAVMPLGPALPILAATEAAASTNADPDPGIKANTETDTDDKEKKRDIDTDLTYEEINSKLESIAQAKGIPAIYLKAIAFRESTWKQWDLKGDPVLSPGEEPAIGIMQISSRYIIDTPQMTKEEIIEELKWDINFNIAYGADLLNQKWALVPQIGDGDRDKLENWYFVLWSYNSWAERNNPNCIPEESARRAYQDEILAICEKPEGFLKQFITPLKIIPLDAALLPKTGVPEANSVWETPLPPGEGEGSVKTQIALTRIAGSDRIDTAIRQACAGWPDGVAAVVLARADDYPDALAGVPLAAQLDAPVLLTPSKELDTRVAEALATLYPQKIYLLGGEGALSKRVSQSLAAIGWDGAKQERIFGADRYATAAAIAEKTNTLAVGTSSVAAVEAVALATGQDFPDALSIAAVAGSLKIPVLLTSKGVLPRETGALLQKLNPTYIYVVGGTGVIPAAVTDQIKTLPGMEQSQIIRLAGTDRYGTAAAVLTYFCDQTQSLAFATGENFPDALAGAALAAKTKSGLVLLPPRELKNYPDLCKYMANTWSGLSSATIFGGEGAVSPQRIEELQDLAG